MKNSTPLEAVNLADENGNLPLHNAIIANNIEQIEFLLKNGANPYLSTRNNKDFPLKLAAKYNDNPNILLKFIEIIPETINKQDESYSNFTLLHYAVDNGCDNIVKLLLDNGANPNLKNFYGETPLFLAKNYPAIYGELLERGADTEILTKLKTQIEIREEQENILKKILDAKKNKVEVKITGKEAMILEYRISSDPDVLALMLEAKASSNSRAKRKSIDPRDNYQPFLIYTNNDISRFNEHIDEVTTLKIPYHYDVVFRDPLGSHCTPMQIHSDGTDVRIFSIDAAADSSNEDVINSIAHRTSAIISYIRGGLQKTSHGCWCFSIKGLNKLSNMPVIEKEKMRQTDVDGKNIPKYIPSPLLVGLQSIKALEEYLTNNSENGPLIVDKKGSNLSDPESDFNKYLVSYKIVQTDGTINEAKQNLTILASSIKYTRKAMEKYHILFNEGGYEKVLETVKKRSDFQGHNTYSASFEVSNLFVSPSPLLPEL
jgi:hypothetical protein